MRSKDPKLLMIKDRIDRLSLNEDERQDLWAAYLENPDINFSNTLDGIKFYKSIHDQISANIVACFYSLSYSSTADALDNFSDLERSVLILLMIGLSIEQISRYKMIEILRLQQMLSNVSVHPIWEELRVKEKTECRREIWTHR